MAQTQGQIIKYNQGKLKFEILTKKGSALKYRQNKNMNIQNILMVDKIFTKLSQGKVAKSGDLRKVFGTVNIYECCKQIIENGELNLSSSERKSFIDKKRNEIIYYIHKNYIDPLTNICHPITRISNVMDECKIRIDTKKSTKKQALNAIKKMQGKLFFAKANSMMIDLEIKYKYDTHKVQNLINSITSGGSFTQKWTETGVVFELEISKCDLEDLQKAIAAPTNGGDYNLIIKDELIAGKNRNAEIIQNKMRQKKKKNRARKRVVDQYMMDPKDFKKLNRKKKKKKLNTYAI